MSDISQGLNFGPFVLVQATVSVVIVLGALFAYQRGRGSAKTDEAKSPDALQIFMQRPLVDGADALKGMYRALQEMRHDNDQTVAEFRQRHEMELTLLRDMLTVLGQLLTETRRK